MQSCPCAQLDHKFPALFKIQLTLFMPLLLDFHSSPEYILNDRNLRETNAPSFYAVLECSMGSGLFVWPQQSRTLTVAALWSCLFIIMEVMAEKIHGAS